MTIAVVSDNGDLLKVVPVELDRTEKASRHVVAQTTIFAIVFFQWRGEVEDFLVEPLDKKGLDARNIIARCIGCKSIF